MDARTLDKILSCEDLPSLPAVALKVIELTRDDNVSLDELGATIQNDQGLASKVLKTVNSSFYGLRSKCSTIERALVMLGLKPVKSLALGFSIVSAVGTREDAFDYQSYWRRGLFTAAAAKLIAEAAGERDHSDEAFLGGLLQDIGQVAMHRALRKDYERVLESTGGDHRALVKAEIAAFELKHPDIGAMLCERWKLPPELVLPVKYHERPTAAPEQCRVIVRSVAGGNILHDVLTDADPTPALRTAYAKLEQWFGLGPEQVDELVRALGEGVSELARLFKLDTGEQVDAESALEAAAGEAKELGTREGSEVDPLTGVYNKQGYDSVIRQTFARASTQATPMAILIIALDGMKEIIGTGTEAIDGEIGMNVSAMLKRHFDPVPGAVCRIGRDTFAVVTELETANAATGMAERFRDELERYSQQWDIPDYPGTLRLTASIGVAPATPADIASLSSASHLTAAAVRAAQAARAQGGNRIVAWERAAA